MGYEAASLGVFSICRISKRLVRESSFGVLGCGHPDVCVCFCVRYFIFIHQVQLLKEEQGHLWKKSNRISHREGGAQHYP